ncbi:MAG: hypothetical protein KA972_05650 [Brachymonas sp.]|nr:hypothetical protein [Brachymonas sp.]
METFSDKTEVSFSQLFKKDGWFSRLIFIQLIALPIHTSIYSVFRPLRNTSDNLAHYFIFIIGSLFIAGHLMIGLLLWKKRTRSTITVAIMLLWILFAVKRVFLGLFGSIIMLLATLQREGVSNALITHRIYELIYAVFLIAIFLALTIIWTRNLKRLKRLCP